MSKTKHHIECDICGKTYPTNIAEQTVEDTIETQEFISIHHRAGYGSIFGDGNLVKCDICQYCAQKILKKYFKIESH